MGCPARKRVVVIRFLFFRWKVAVEDSHEWRDDRIGIMMNSDCMYEIVQQCDHCGVRRVEFAGRASSLYRRGYDHRKVKGASLAKDCVVDG